MVSSLRTPEHDSCSMSESYNFNFWIKYFRIFSIPESSPSVSVSVFSEDGPGLSSSGLLSNKYSINKYINNF